MIPLTNHDSRVRENRVRSWWNLPRYGYVSPKASHIKKKRLTHMIHIKNLEMIPLIFIYSDIIYIYEIYSHTIWHFLRNLSRILSGIWSGHLSDILYDIHFDILSDILSDILTGISSSNLECDLHSIWCIIWLSIWNFIEFYLALYLTLYLTCYTLSDMYSALLSYILSGILFGHRVQRVSYWVHANYLQARSSIFSSYSFSVFPRGILVDGFNPSEKY